MQITRHPPVRTSLEPSNHPYLTGPWTPLHEEVDVAELRVIEGAIPADIDGIYLRNTENQVHQPLGRHHPFDGDAMIHQVNITGGKASYRNRFVRTHCFEAEQIAGRREGGMATYLLTAQFDNRAGEGRIASRIGIGEAADTFAATDDMFAKIKARLALGPIACVFIDEAQFLTEGQVWQLARIADDLKVNIGVMVRTSVEESLRSHLDSLREPLRPAAPAPLTLFAAASLTDAVTELAAKFQAEGRGALRNVVLDVPYMGSAGRKLPVGLKPSPAPAPSRC